MDQALKVLPARFFRSAAGEEPVRQWLKGLEREDRYIIGEAIKTVELGWPVGMPVCRPITSYKNLWEVRCSLAQGRIARVLFSIQQGEMILLHGFVKKTRKTPQKDLDLALKRKKEYERYG